MGQERSRYFSFRTQTASETEEFAARLGGRITGSALISLTGPLGAGKSVVARGVCRGMGVEEGVLSPTFILFEEYVGRRPVIHCDLYRLEHEQEIADLGVFDRIGDGSVIMVEWADRSRRLSDLADCVISLEIAGQNDRTIEVACTPALAPCFEAIVS